MKFVPAKARKNREYWVTNINYKKDISISDLGVVIRAGTTVNLMDKKHYSFTYEQLEKSRESGALKSRSEFLKIRDLPPINPIAPGIHKATQSRITKLRMPGAKIDNKIYEELGDFDNTSAEKFAAEMADIAHMDNVPALAKDDKYLNIRPEPQIHSKKFEKDMDEFLASQDEMPEE